MEEHFFIRKRILPHWIRRRVRKLTPKIARANFLYTSVQEVRKEDSAIVSVLIRHDVLTITLMSLPTSTEFARHFGIPLRQISLRREIISCFLRVRRLVGLFSGACFRASPNSQHANSISPLITVEWRSLLFRESLLVLRKYRYLENRLILWAPNAASRWQASDKGKLHNPT